MNSYHEKLARILRVDKHIILELEQLLEKTTGKMGILGEIVTENDQMLSKKMSELGLIKGVTAHEAYDAIISKIESDDLALLKYIGLDRRDNDSSAKRTVEFVKKIHTPGTGFFLKKEKAAELLLSEPPKKILSALNYPSVDIMLAKEDLLEVYSALRFLEDANWLNNVFFKQYEKLTPEDFEERKIELRALSPKWGKAAERFVAKKYHNVSHLKELGVIFVIPVFLGISGETLRLVSLLLHYLNEVIFYSELFKRLAGTDGAFASKFISLLRGDVIEKPLARQLVEAKRPRFLVIQRYLAKGDENDWRLFQPRVNPEAIHWEKAEQELVNASEKIPDFKNGLEFWRDLGTVGDFFRTDVGVEVLVSFNIVDTVMALVQRKELVKYLYHQQEALWNKIFMRYFGHKTLEENCKRYIFKGWFEI